MVDCADAKFAQHLSHFGGCDFGDDIDWLFYETLIAFISWEYIQILVDGSFSLFYYDSRVKRPLPGKKDLWIGGVEDPDYAAGITTSTEMHGFQQIIALSHASLDSIFHTYYRERGWMRFSNEDGFKINFGVPKVRLLGGDRALVFIHLESGILRTGHTESVRSSFLSTKFNSCSGLPGKINVSLKIGHSPSRSRSACEMWISAAPASGRSTSTRMRTTPRRIGNIRILSNCTLTLRVSSGLWRI